jgi:putative transposase
MSKPMNREVILGRLLSDAYRSGTPPKFSAEQVVQIIALACEAPLDSERPVSHWTPKEIAAEAMRRGIVKSISVQSVERFLKRC